MATKGKTPSKHRYRACYPRDIHAIPANNLESGNVGFGHSRLLPSQPPRRTLMVVSPE
jgi:hypothetical protein